MATSGSTNFSQTRNEVIFNAFQLLGIYGIGRTVSTEDISFASAMLNMMLKSWSAMGLHLWAKQEGIVHLTPYVGEYSLGSYSYFTNKEDEVINQLTSSRSAADTSIIIADTSTLAAADNVGVVLDTGYIHWTTIASITNSTTFVLTSALPSAAAASNLVYSFTSTAGKPLRILSARFVQGYDGGASGTTQTELPMTSISYEEYWNLAMTTNSSEFSNQFHYAPKVSNGMLYLWPRPTSGASRVQITYERLIEDLDNIDDNFDLPAEWLEPVTWQLAIRIGPAFGKDQRMQVIGAMASEMLENLKNWDNEITSIRFVPDRGSE